MSELPDPRNDLKLMQAYRDAATTVLNDRLTLEEHKLDVQPLQFALLAATATAEWIDKHKESRNA